MLNRLRMLVRTFFGFSRIETNGFLLLVPLTLLILFSEPLYHRLTRSDTNYFANAVKTDSLMALLHLVDTVQAAKARKAIDTIAFHFFNPNTAKTDELLALGMVRQLAQRIDRYREKGGKFRKKEDMLKIFGMDTAWYRKAKEWMLFSRQTAKPESFGRKSEQTKSLEDINLADSIALVAVYGIGPVLARRIVQFRNRLGGFITMDQLREVYGLDSSVVKTLKRWFEVREGFQPRKITINEATLEELAVHPYMTRRQAQAIIAYRLQHGALDSLPQLLHVKLLDASWVDKIKEYLSLDQK